MEPDPSQSATLVERQSQRFRTRFGRGGASSASADPAHSGIGAASAATAAGPGAPNSYDDSSGNESSDPDESAASRHPTLIEAVGDVSAPKRAVAAKHRGGAGAGTSATAKSPVRRRRMRSDAGGDGAHGTLPSSSALAMASAAVTSGAIPISGRGHSLTKPIACANSGGSGGSDESQGDHAARESTGASGGSASASYQDDASNYAATPARSAAASAARLSMGLTRQHFFAVHRSTGRAMVEICEGSPVELRSGDAADLMVIRAPACSMTFAGSPSKLTDEFRSSSITPSFAMPPPTPAATPGAGAPASARTSSFAYSNGGGGSSSCSGCESTLETSPSIVSDLFSVGINLQQLAAEAKPQRAYRRHYSGWLTNALRRPRPVGVEYKRLLVMEDNGALNYRRVINNTFSFLTLLGTGQSPVKSVLVPLTREYGSNLVDVLTYVLDASLRWCSAGLPIQTIRIVLPAGYCTPPVHRLVQSFHENIDSLGVYGPNRSAQQATEEAAAAAAADDGAASVEGSAARSGEDGASGQVDEGDGGRAEAAAPAPPQTRRRPIDKDFFIIYNTEDRKIAWELIHILRSKYSFKVADMHSHALVQAASEIAENKMHGEAALLPSAPAGEPRNSGDNSQEARDERARVATAAVPTDAHQRRSRTFNSEPARALDERESAAPPRAVAGHVNGTEHEGGGGLASAFAPARTDERKKNGEEERDHAAGATSAYLADEWYTALMHARRTVAIVSDNFFRSPPCSTLFSQAACRNVELEGEALFVIYWQSADLPSLAQRLFDSNGVDCREMNRVQASEGVKRLAAAYNRALRAEKIAREQQIVTLKGRRQLPAIGGAGAPGEGDAGGGQRRAAAKKQHGGGGGGDDDHDHDDVNALAVGPEQHDTETEFFDDAPIMFDREWREKWDVPVSELQVGTKLGSGAFGDVFMARWRNRPVAVKQLTRGDDGFTLEVVEDFQKEMRLLSQLEHPNIVRFYGAVTRPPNLCIVLGFISGGSLYRRIHARNLQDEGPFTPREVAHLALGIARGLQYLHAQSPPVVHRDLKSPNVLIDAETNGPVVTDFGLSRSRVNSMLLTGAAGTPEWMAPEIMRNEAIDEKSDVFSYGVIVWELVTCQKPWADEHPIQVIFRVAQRHEALSLPSACEPSLRTLIESCFRQQSKRRPDFTDIVQFWEDYAARLAQRRGGGEGDGDGEDGGRAAVGIDDGDAAGGGDERGGDVRGGDERGGDEHARVVG